MREEIRAVLGQYLLVPQLREESPRLGHACQPARNTMHDGTAVDAKTHKQDAKARRMRRKPLRRSGKRTLVLRELRRVGARTVVPRREVGRHRQRHVVSIAEHPCARNSQPSALRIDRLRQDRHVIIDDSEILGLVCLANVGRARLANKRDLQGRERGEHTSWRGFLRRDVELKELLLRQRAPVRARSRASSER